MEVPNIVTDRLKIAGLGRNDAEAMYQYRSDPEVCRYQNWVPDSMEEVETFISGLSEIAFDTADTWYQLAIRLGSNGTLIGDVGIHFMADQSRQAEIGITIAPAHQGKGYAVESVTAILDYLFVELRKHRIFASVDPRNSPSLKLLKRIGMRQEAHFRQSLWFKGEWADDVIFALLKEEWEKGR